MSEWKRIGDFFSRNAKYVGEKEYAQRFLYPVMIHGVDFHNKAPKAIVRQISVVHYSDGKTYMHIEASPIHYPMLSAAFEQYFKNDFEELHPLSHTIKIKFNLQSLPKLIRLFHSIHKQIKIQEFPNDLIKELEQIAIALTLDQTSFYANKHLIHDGKIAKSYINPDRENSQALINHLLKYSSSNRNLSKFISKTATLLTKGENPNQKNITGNTPLTIIVFLEDFLLFELLPLCAKYGANLYETENMSGLTPLELVIKYRRNTKALTFVSNFYERLENKKIPNPQLMIPLNFAALFPNRKKNNIITKLQFSNSEAFLSCIKEMGDLTKKERETLLDIYKIDFKPNKHNKIEETFAHAFAPGKDKLVDIIYNKHRTIIGATTFFLGKEENEISVIIDLSFIKQKYKGSGIMSLFIFRIPYAIQTIYQDCLVSILYLAASYHGISKAGDFYYPKYQPDGKEERIKKKHETLYGHPLIWSKTENGVYVTVREEDHVSVVMIPQEKMSPRQLFYYQWLLGNKKDDYVPCEMPAGDVLLEEIQDTLSPRINFTDQYKKLAVLLRETTILWPLEKSPEKLDFILNSQFAFWKNKIIEENNEALKQKLNYPPTPAMAKY